MRNIHAATGGRHVQDAPGNRGWCGLTAAVLGILYLRTALGPFFAANVGSATGVSKDPPALVWVLLARLPLALMLALAMSKGEARHLVGRGCEGRCDLRLSRRHTSSSLMCI